MIQSNRLVYSLLVVVLTTVLVTSKCNAVSLHQSCLKFQDIRYNLRSVLILSDRILLVTQQLMVFEATLINEKLMIKYNESSKMEDKWPSLRNITKFEVNKKWFQIAISLVGINHPKTLVSLIYKDNSTNNNNKEANVSLVTLVHSKVQRIRSTKFHIDIKLFIKQDGAFITTTINSLFYSIQNDPTLNRQLYFRTWLPYNDSDGSLDITPIFQRNYYIFYRPQNSTIFLSTDPVTNLTTGFRPMTDIRFKAGFISSGQQLYLFCDSYYLRIGADILQNVSRISTLYSYDNISMKPSSCDKPKDLLISIVTATNTTEKNLLLKIILPISILGIIILVSVVFCSFSKYTNTLVQPSSKIIESEIQFGPSTTTKQQQSYPDCVKSQLINKTKSNQKVKSSSSLGRTSSSKIQVPYKFAHPNYSNTKTLKTLSFKLSKLSLSKSPSLQNLKSYK